MALYKLLKNTTTKIIYDSNVSIYSSIQRSSPISERSTAATVVKKKQKPKQTGLQPLHKKLSVALDKKEVGTNILLRL
jgi:hypothetical protein